MSNAVAVRDIGTRSVAGVDTQAMRRVGLVRPSANPAEIMTAHKEIATMVAEVLEENVDFGVIPGTDGKKALLKAGAERLAFSIGASIELEVLEKEVDHMLEVPWRKVKKVWSGPKGRRTCTESEVSGVSQGVYRYVVKARLVRREDGAILGEGIGSCSTMESKYIDRPRDTENTVLKMAKKRASVDAVLSTMALTGRFAPEEGAEDERDTNADEDGVVADPTDGLTLETSLEYKFNKVPLSTMSPKTLTTVRIWCDNKLKETPDDPKMLRLSAMVDMVAAFRVTHPLPPKDDAADEPKAPSAPVASTPAAPIGADSSDPFAGTDDDDLPF